MSIQGKLIHVGRFGDGTYAFLRKNDSNLYSWWIQSVDGEKESGITGPSAEEALRKAHQNWKDRPFRTVICGFRYTLPERDEHGTNALFHQMISSYSTPNGVYLDEELGHTCHVQFASDEALNLWKELKIQNRIN